jgi:hypothetical protein
MACLTNEHSSIGGHVNDANERPFGNIELKPVQKENIERLYAVVAGPRKCPRRILPDALLTHNQAAVVRSRHGHTGGKQCLLVFR